MTPEQQRIALAKWDGWTRIFDAAFRQWIQRSPDGSDVICDPNPDAGWETQRLPDFLNDLNAVAKLEEKLTDEQIASYVDWFFHNLPEEESLGPSPDGDGDIMAVGLWQLLHATASQRCEALLKTLGLWKSE